MNIYALSFGEVNELIKELAQSQISESVITDMDRLCKHQSKRIAYDCTSQTSGHTSTTYVLGSPTQIILN